MGSKKECFKTVLFIFIYLYFLFLLSLILQYFFFGNAIHSPLLVKILVIYLLEFFGFLIQGIIPSPVSHCFL